MTEERKVQYDCAYMRMAYDMAQLSYAIRHKVGAIIVSAQGQIISQGFNGTPAGYDNECETVECSCQYKYGCAKTAESIESSKCVELCKDCQYCKLVTKPEVLHAETNAISKISKWHSSSEGATVYVTLSPCIDCSKIIIQSGIKRVVFSELYRDVAGIEMLQKVGIQVQQLDLDNSILKDVIIDE